MAELLLLALFLPLAGFLLLMAFSEILQRKWIYVIGCSTIFISFICFAFLLMQIPVAISLFQWIPVPGIDADFNLHLDGLSSLMTLIITGVGFLIHIYSVGYMEHEKDQARYFACLNFFVFAMLLLVLAGNLLLLFVGWEGVGLASYLLIGFWFEKPSAAKAATKAFVVNRIGDFGFLVGLLLTFSLFGTSDIASLLQLAPQEFAVGAPAITLLTLLLFTGATGKSAQIPLHVWLPDAMAGPTPVSALIHAATMVTAGVYLIVRLAPLFLLAPITMLVIAIIGAATALFAAFSALGQTDLKRVLAYSTVSQLGFMFLACGVGAFYAAMFHLTMHAFIKALLFLSAGNVIHMLHDKTEMAEMGGLAKIFTKTHWLFLIGVLALSGIPPLAAFFSKDLILEQTYSHGFIVLFAIGLFSAFLTAIYLTRAYFLAFKGPLLEENKMASEAPRVMTLPLSLLALLSVFGGLLGFSYTGISPLEKLLAGSGILYVKEGNSFTILLSAAGAFLGVFGAAFVYAQFANRLGRTLAVLKQAFYIDEIYKAAFVQPLSDIAMFISSFMEPKVFENALGASAQAAELVAENLQRVQNGQIRSYVAWMTIGAVFLIVYLMF